VDLDELRAHDFGHLDAEGHTCLDCTGAGLAPSSLVRASAARITGGVFGNPHSESPAARASGDLPAAARAAVLRHFAADPAEHAVVFTANVTAALRLVGESYPFAPGGRLVLLLAPPSSPPGPAPRTPPGSTSHARPDARTTCGTYPNSGPGGPDRAPSCRTAPVVGLWSPARVCDSTVLPAPLLPAITVSCPAPTSNDTSSNTRPAPRTSCVTSRNSRWRPVVRVMSGRIGVDMGAACHPGVSHTVAKGGRVSRRWPSSGLTGSGLVTSLPP